MHIVDHPPYSLHHLQAPPFIPRYVFIHHAELQPGFIVDLARGLVYDTMGYQNKLYYRNKDLFETDEDVQSEFEELGGSINDIINHSVTSGARIADAVIFSGYLWTVQVDQPSSPSSAMDFVVRIIGRLSLIPRETGFFVQSVLCTDSLNT